MKRPVSLRERLLRLRDRLASSTSLQRAASSVPVVRHVAAWHTSRLFDLCAGFVYSQVLAAVIELGLLEFLATQPRSRAALRRHTGLNERALDTLLRAAFALRLLAPRDAADDDDADVDDDAAEATVVERGVGLGLDGALLLGNDGARRMVVHHAVLYRDLTDIVGLLKAPFPPSTGLRRFWDYHAATSPADAPATHQASSYSALMAGSIGLVAHDVVESLPLRGVSRVIDVGGGVGDFLATLSPRLPDDATLTLVDLPAVTALAAARHPSLVGRLHTVAADARHAPLPGPADLVTFVRVIHDHDDDDAVAMLRAARAALGPGGSVVIAEPLSETAGAERMGDAYFGLYLYAMGQGRPRSLEGITALAARAGLRVVRELPARRKALCRVVLLKPL
jgi:demethylspheroidene O-methyltransferase